MHMCAVGSHAVQIHAVHSHARICIGNTGHTHMPVGYASALGIQAFMQYSCMHVAMWGLQGTCMHMVTWGKMHAYVLTHAYLL